MRKSYEERKAEVIKILQEFIEKLDKNEVDVHDLVIQRELDTSFINKFGGIDTHLRNDWKMVVFYQETTKEVELLKELG